MVGVAAAAIFTFSVTRLNDIPRSVPAVHFLLLFTAMNFFRLLHRTLAHRRSLNSSAPLQYEEEQNVIVVGANKLAWFYIQMLNTLGAGNRRVVAILDDDKSLSRPQDLRSSGSSAARVRPFLWSRFFCNVYADSHFPGFVVCERDRVSH